VGQEDLVVFLERTIGTKEHWTVMWESIISTVLYSTFFRSTVMGVILL
jgi:hypothetical protein